MQMRKHKRTRILLKEAAFIMAFLLSFNSCFFYISSYAASSTDLVYENDYTVDDGLKDDGSVSENEALIDDTVSENMLTDSKKVAAYDEDSDIEIAIDDLTDEDYPTDNEDLFAAYFDEKKSGKSYFTKEDVDQYYNEARRTKPSNVSMCLNQLAKKGFIMDAEGEWLEVNATKSEITVNIVKDKMLYGLPAALINAGRLKHSHVIVPTSPTFWGQDKMNLRYGIEKMYSKFDYDKDMTGYEDLNDEQIFQMASLVETTAEQPFFSLVLTMSMHNPYTKCVEHGFTLADKSLTTEYLNYLVDCHYTDMQIEKYIKHLKQQGLYDNSVIVIAADHQAHPAHLNMADSQVIDELPLYIINGGINSSNAWTGRCNQLDVYTTLLDIYGVRSTWRGLGHSLLNANYQEYNVERLQTLSDWIIRSNYFEMMRKH